MNAAALACKRWCWAHYSKCTHFMCWPHIFGLRIAPKLHRTQRCFFWAAKSGCLPLRKSRTSPKVAAAGGFWFIPALWEKNEAWTSQYAKRSQRFAPLLYLVWAWWPSGSTETWQRLIPPIYVLNLYFHKWQTVLWHHHSMKISWTPWMLRTLQCKIAVELLIFFLCQN